MLFYLLLLFVAVPLVELFLLLLLAEWTSGLFTFALVIVTGLVGTWLARAQGFRTYQRIQRELADGRAPTQSLLDAAMIFVAGALLLTPGILTDALGMSLLIPVCRHGYRRLVSTWIHAHFKVQSYPDPYGDSDSPPRRSEVIDSYVVDADEED